MAQGAWQTTNFTPWMSRLVAGLPRAGAAGILLQVLALTVAVLPAALGRITSLPTSDDVVTHALVGGIIVSRFGLWLFDLCVSQIMQEAIPAHELGVPLFTLPLMLSLHSSLCALKRKERIRQQKCMIWM